MKPLFSRVAVLGLGLLGGSVAVAARTRGLAGRVVGSARRPGPLEEALRNGVVDEVADPASAVRGADLVVLGTPVSSMAKVLERVAPELEQGALVTDVGSVKGVLANTLPGLLPPGVHYIGSHPMAGSHVRGVEYARADLFEGACCVVTPPPDSRERDRERLVAFWRGLGARVVERDPLAHDEQVAWVSHVPHVLAFAFAEALRQAPSEAGELAGSGFSDFTRIGQSDAELWGDILSANRKCLPGPLDAFGQALSRLARAIEKGDVESQESFLASARDQLARVAAFGAREHGVAAEDPVPGTPRES
jgi:cyclohexadieny/prephenate dehydrogenase